MFEDDELELDRRGLVQVYLATWPYILAELRHFAALLTGRVALMGWGTVIGFLGFDVMVDSVWRGEPLSGAQAGLLFLEPAGFVGVDTLNDAARTTVLYRFQVWTILTTILGILAFQGLELYKTWILQRVNQHLRVQLVQNTQALSLTFHRNHQAGDAVYRVFQDSAMVTRVIDVIVVLPVTAGSTLIVQVAVASLFSPVFAMLLGIGALTLIGILVWYTPRLRAVSGVTRAASAALVGRVQESFQSILVLKAYSALDRTAALFGAESRRAIDAAYALRSGFAGVKVVSAFVLAMVLFVSDYIAAELVHAEGAVLGASLLVYLGLSVTVWTLAAYDARRSSISTFSTSFEDLIRGWCQAQDMAMGLGRVFGLLDVRPAVEAPANPTPFPAAIDGIEFQDVRFAYAETDALRDVSFTAGAGQLIALVGSSGSGKSTLLSLLLRLFDPAEGRILVNGIDLREFDPIELRRRVAVALQENTLFPLSIADNLRYGIDPATPSPTEVDLIEALAVADAEFVLELADGLETELDVGGARLSTGQKQRISIARALLRNPAVLILDEPTASLDPMTERRVLENLKTWAKDRVVFLVTHRLDAVVDADQILVIDERTIVEAGTHETLIQAGGRYAALIEADNNVLDP